MLSTLVLVVSPSSNVVHIFSKHPWCISYRGCYGSLGGMISPCFDICCPPWKPPWTWLWWLRRRNPRIELHSDWELPSPPAKNIFSWTPNGFDQGYDCGSLLLFAWVWDCAILAGGQTIHIWDHDQRSPNRNVEYDVSEFPYVPNERSHWDFCEDST